MVQNLWWAAGDNIVALALVAGVLAPWGIVLHPAVGAVADVTRHGSSSRSCVHVWL